MSQRPNRRTAIRHNRRMKVPCSMKRVIEDAPFEVTVALVSSAAVRLHVAAPLGVGTFHAVDLPDERGRPVGRLFRVTRAQPGRPSATVEGLFVKKLDDPTVEVLQPRLAGGRGWKTTCRAVQVRQEGPWLATMQNVSHSGIGLVSERAIDPGAFLEVSLPSIRRQHLKPRIIRVTNARRQDDGDWSLGAVFVRALTEEELQVLL